MSKKKGAQRKKGRTLTKKKVGTTSTDTRPKQSAGQPNTLKPTGLAACLLDIAEQLNKLHSRRDLLAADRMIEAGRLLIEAIDAGAFSRRQYPDAAKRLHAARQDAEAAPMGVFIAMARLILGQTNVYPTPDHLPLFAERLTREATDIESGAAKLRSIGSNDAPTPPPSDPRSASVPQIVRSNWLEASDNVCTMRETLAEPARFAQSVRAAIETMTPTLALIPMMREVPVPIRHGPENVEPFIWAWAINRATLLNLCPNKPHGKLDVQECQAIIGAIPNGWPTSGIVSCLDKIQRPSALQVAIELMLNLDRIWSAEVGLTYDKTTGEPIGNIAEAASDDPQLFRWYRLAIAGTCAWLPESYCCEAEKIQTDLAMTAGLIEDELRRSSPGRPDEQHNPLDGLHGKAWEAGKYIIENPGQKGDNIAHAISITPGSFRKHIVPKLKEADFYNADGYQPPRV